MAKKQVLIRIDEDLNKRWALVSKKIKMSKTAMIESMLENSLPILEQDNPTDMVSSMFQEMGKTFQDVGSLFHEDKK
jgi:hypothetical protein